MRLELSGTPEIAAPAERVWKRLLDHEFVAGCAPGIERVEALDDRHFKVISGIGVGSVKLRFELEVELADVRPPKSARMLVRGKAPGSAVDLDTSVEVERLAPDRTRLNWRAAAEVRGTVASVGARLVKSAAKKVAGDFWKRFARRAGRSPGTASC